MGDILTVLREVAVIISFERKTIANEKVRKTKILSRYIHLKLIGLHAHAYGVPVEFLASNDSQSVKYSHPLLIFIKI